MSIKIHKAEGEMTLELEGEITVRQASHLAARLNEELKGNVPVTVIGTGIRDVDTSILQLLCSLRKTVPVFTLQSASAEFEAAVDRCGMRRELLGGPGESI